MQVTEPNSKSVPYHDMNNNKKRINKQTEL